MAVEFNLPFRSKKKNPADYITFLIRENTPQVYERLWLVEDRELPAVFQEYKQLVIKAMYNSYASTLSQYFAFLYEKFDYNAGNPKNEYDYRLEALAQEEASLRCSSASYCKDEERCNQIRAEFPKLWEARRAYIKEHGAPKGSRPDFHPSIIEGKRGEHYKYQHDTYLLVNIDSEESEAGLEDITIPWGELEYEKVLNTRSGGYENNYQWTWKLKKGTLEKIPMKRILHNVEQELAAYEPSFQEFVRQLRSVMQALAKEPITSGSGLNQPRKRTQIHYLTHPRKTIMHPRQTITHPRKTIIHPQRTYQDMQGEIANQLVGLPPYTARVKLATKGKPIEHTIQTLDPKKLATKVFYGVALQDRIARIQSQNRKDRYTRSRQDVEDEITNRQTQCSQQTQQPPLQPQPPHRKQILTCQKCGATNPQGAKFCNQCGAAI